MASLPLALLAPPGALLYNPCTPHDDLIAASVLDLLRNRDPDVAEIIAAEQARQASTIELIASENQARRMLQDIKSYGAWLQQESDRAVPLNVAAVRWLDRVFEPVMAAIPAEMFDRLEAAEIFHQLLEHRWYKSEETGENITLMDVLDDYLAVLAKAPPEKRRLDDLALVEPLDESIQSSDETDTVSDHE